MKDKETLPARSIADPSHPNYKLCPIRVPDGSSHCWGIRCAAFRQIDNTSGVCALIPEVAR